MIQIIFKILKQKYIWIIPSIFFSYISFKSQQANLDKNNNEYSKNIVYASIIFSYFALFVFIIDDILKKIGLV